MGLTFLSLGEGDLFFLRNPQTSCIWCGFCLPLDFKVNQVKGTRWGQRHLDIIPLPEAAPGVGEEMRKGTEKVQVENGNAPRSNKEEWGLIDKAIAR